MTAVTKAVELTEFQTVVLAAMRTGGGFGTSREIAELAGFKPEPVRACLAKLSDRGLTYAEPSLKKGEPPTWYLAETAAPIPSASDGTPGDDEPAPEPGDTQAVGEVEAAPVPDHSASLDDPDNFGDDEMQTAAPGPDGWIPWRDGECPVPDGVTCWVRFRDGSVVFQDNPFDLIWANCNDPCDIVAYRLDTPKYAIIAGYLDAVAAESAADSATLTGDDVCSADAVIAEWKRKHAPAAPTVAPADPFAVWLADTPAGCAGQRAIDAAEQEAARLRAEAAEMVREAAEALEFGLIVAEIIRFADQRNASTSTSEAEFGLAELMAAAYEAVTGKRVA